MIDGNLGVSAFQGQDDGLSAARCRHCLAKCPVHQGRRAKSRIERGADFGPGKIGEYGKIILSRHGKTPFIVDLQV